MADIKLLALTTGGSLEALRSAAQRFGGRVEEARSIPELFERLRDSTWSATLVSLASDLVDEAVVNRISSTGSSGLLVLSTPRPSLDAALLAERSGAVGVLGEPLEADALEPHLESLAGERREVPLPATTRDSTPAIVGESGVMAKVFGLIAKVSPSDSTVLITGESGTGKEVVARAIHQQSARSRGPFVAVNCAAIPEHLLESELFGHERGAFTGAVGQRKGRFERANGGTLFLDEIGDMSIVLQAKVLRVLEERVVERVGGERSDPIDVRVIAATNQVLPVAIEEGRFREDLYYRLGVVEIDLPPLRDRGLDVRRLALHFAAHFAEQHGRPVRAITERALERLERASWPGNVRELRNVMDRAVLLTTGDVLRSASLRLGHAAPRASSHTAGDHPNGYPPHVSLAEIEADHIRKVLTSVDRQVGKAAAVLGIHRNTLTRKIQEYGLDVAPSTATPG